MMNKIVCSLFLSCCFLVSTKTQANAHKFYMSITDMEYNSESGSLEIIIKFFTDDIEKTLEEKSGKRLFLGTEKEASSFNDLLYSYLKDNFYIQQEKAIKQFIFLGKEVAQDYTWVYLEIEKFNSDTSFVLTNQLLIDLFEEQTNKVNYKKGLISKSYTFHKDLITIEF